MEGPEGDPPGGGNRSSGYVWFGIARVARSNRPGSREVGQYAHLLISAGKVSIKSGFLVTVNQPPKHPNKRHLIIEKRTMRSTVLLVLFACNVSAAF